MALVAPKVRWRPLARQLSTVPIIARIINLHTMVGYLASTERYFSAPGRAYSHFGAGGSGEIRQWQDLRFKAASDLNGNPYSFSVECEDHGPDFPPWSGSNVPGFTSRQIDALVELIAWLCVRFNIPPVLLNDSLPGRMGMSYHRLGVNPWRVSGGILYSSAYGKVCPGDRRIKQIREVIAPRVQARIAGSPAPVPPVPQPPKEWDEMATKAEIAQVMEDALAAQQPESFFARVPGTSAVYVVNPLVGTKALVHGWDPVGDTFHFLGVAWAKKRTPFEVSKEFMDNLYELRPGFEAGVEMRLVAAQQMLVKLTGK